MSKKTPINVPKNVPTPKPESIKNYDPEIRKGIVFEAPPTPPPKTPPKKDSK